MKRIQSLFEQYSGIRGYGITPLPSSGGNRRYFRITWDGGSCIAAAGTSLQENTAFLYLDRHFSRLGYRVPKVLAVSEDSMCYLQEDLGDTTLFDAVSAGPQKRDLFFRRDSPAAESRRDPSRIPVCRSLRPRLFHVPAHILI